MTLSLRGLTVGRAGRLLCDDLSVTMRVGQCWAILGRNGAGKSTLLQTLAGLHPPLRGSVAIDGWTLSASAPRKVAQTIGLLLQEEANAYAGTVREYVGLGRYPYHRGWSHWEPDDEEMLQTELAQMELHALADRPLAHLSGGERQRARIAMLLVQSPAVYCLDEPLLHLDLCHQAMIMRRFRELADSGRTVVMVLHDLTWARRFCDHTLLLDGNGGTQFGTTAEMLVPERLERIFGCPMQVWQSAEPDYVPE